MVVSSTPGDHPGVVNPVTVTNTHPPHKTTLAAQTLLQQVWINVDEDSEENSDEFEDEHFFCINTNASVLCRFRILNGTQSMRNHPSSTSHLLIICQQPGPTITAHINCP